MIGAGGKKGISFYSSEDYLKASSHSSDVFQNPPLCGTFINDDLNDRQRVLFNIQCRIVQFC